jgi:protein TonB
MADGTTYRSYRTTRSLARAERRDRALARIPVERRVVARPEDERSSRIQPIPIWLAASLSAHIGIAVVGALMPAGRAHANDAFDQAVEVIEPPKPAETTPPPPPETPPPDKIDPIIARPTKVAIEPPKPTPTDEPPADPTEAPTVVTPTKPTRRVIGLNLDSTVQGGNGPSYATGNTRMGETSRTASDPNGIAPLPGAQLVPPRRTHEVQPDYPAALRAQNVEGEVVLKVDVDATGHVSNVVVVTPSPHAAFNVAAVAAAKASTYSPALMGGVAIANTIQFTVRFRLKH